MKTEFTTDELSQALGIMTITIVLSWIIIGLWLGAEILGKVIITQAVFPLFVRVYSWLYYELKRRR